MDEETKKKQQSEEPDVLSELEKINKQEEELKQRVVENNAAMEQRKDDLRKAERAGVESAKYSQVFGAKYGLGGGNIAETISESARAATTTYAETKKNETSKESAKPKGETIDLNALKDQGKYEQDKDMLGMAEIKGQGLKWIAETQTYDAYTARQTALSNFKKGVVQGVMDDYFLSTGQLDKVGMEARVDEKVKKPNTSSKALDELKAQGATQIDAPEIPPEDKGALVDMIISSIADMAKNIGGMVSGDAATSVAIASSQTAGEISGERVQAMIARDLANYEQRKEKIRLLNAELMAKHKSDIVAYTSEFEQRASAEERAYQNLRMQSLDMEYNRAMQIMGIYQNVEDLESQAAVAKEAAENQLKRFNRQGEMDVAQHNQSMEMKRQMFNLQVNQARMDAEKLKKQGYLGMEKLLASPGIQFAQIAGVDNIASALHYSINDINTFKPTPEDLKIELAGSNLGGNYFNRVKGLVGKGIDAEGAVRAIRVANTMAMRGYLPKSNLNDAEIIELSKADVSISPDADVQMGQGLPMFSRVANRSNVYFMNVMNSKTMTMYEQAAESYQKMPSSERGANPMPAGFPWGVTE
jgi:hypothetical protein